MNKLLSMELKRAAKSPILWLGVIAVIAINVYGILLNGYGFKIFTTTFLLENSDLICIILAVLIPLYLGSDFENRTINNKISAGYTRKEIYIVELIVSSICATVLFVADILSVFTSSNIAGLEFSDKVNVTEFAFHAAIAFVCIITVSALYTMIVMISHKQLISLGIAGIRSEVLLHTLEEKGIYVSSGSACASNHPAISGVLKGIGAGKEYLDATLRFSMSEFTTEEEIDYTLETLYNCVPMLRKYTRH